MTLQTCKRMADLLRAQGKELEAKEYDARYARKVEKVKQLLSLKPDMLTPEGKKLYYYQEKVKAQYPNFEEMIKEDKPDEIEVKEDGKKSKR